MIAARNQLAFGALKIGRAPGRLMAKVREGDAPDFELAEAPAHAPTGSPTTARGTDPRLLPGGLHPGLHQAVLLLPR